MPPHEEVAYITAEEHLQEFLRVCLHHSCRTPARSASTIGGSLEDGGAGEAEVTPEFEGEAGGSEPVAHPYLNLAGYMFVLGVICPVVFFLCLLPLELRDLPIEFGAFYYTLVARLPFLAFGSSLVQLCLGRGPPWLVSACFCALTMAVDVVDLLVGLPCAFIPGWKVGGSLLMLYFPVMYVMAQQVKEGGRVRPVLMHTIGLSMGAIPPLLCAVYYTLVHHMGWGDRWYLTAPIMLLWSVMPVILKAVGRPLWLASSPAIPGLAGVLWVYYCEASFSCFGFLVFMHTTASALAYANSLVLVLAFLAMRGTKRGFRVAPCMNTLTLHRATLYLDAFAAVMGRVAAYALYMALSVLQLWLPSQGVADVRPSLLGRQRLVTISANICRLQDISPTSLGVAAAGMLLVSAIHVAFNFTVPRIWRNSRDDPRIAAETPPAAWSSTSGTAPNDDFDSALPRAISGVSSLDGKQGFGHRYISEVTPKLSGSVTAHPSGSMNGSAWSSDGGEVTATDTGWLTSTTSKIASRRQHEVVLRFIVEFRMCLVLTGIFVFTLSVLMVNLVLNLLPDSGASMCV